MKAIVWTDYGPPDVLKLREIEKPVPKDNEVLIRIHATTVTSGDCEQRSLRLPFRYALPMRLFVGFKEPKRITILGMDVAGEIEYAGKDVKRFRKGDQVFGSTGVRFGAHAEYICLPEEPEGGALAIKPVNMSYEEAAAVPVGGLEALTFLRQGNIQNKQKILINGAGGTIGPFAIQLAKYFGAEVTGVESTRKLDMLCLIGADHVIDYTQQNFAQNGEIYDFILDVVSKSPFSDSIRSLSENGCYLIANPGLSQVVRGRWTRMISSKEVMFGAVRPKTEDLIFLKEIIEAGKLESVIDKRFPLRQTPEAHRYVETGQKKGNVVIFIEHNNKT